MISTGKRSKTCRSVTCRRQRSLIDNDLVGDFFTGKYLAAAILIVAGAYQLTPWKGACLTHCRSPLGFLMTNWRDGQLGALRMGIGHGAYCLGCCWALMCVLFVVGVMNLIWVAALTALVLLEKIGPGGAIVARAAGAAMVLAGILLPVFAR